LVPCVVVGVGRVSCVASSRVVSLSVVEAFTVVSVQLIVEGQSIALPEPAEQQPCRASGACVTAAPCVGVDVSPGGAVVTWVFDAQRS
jgi:hypothetical protein